MPDYRPCWRKYKLLRILAIVGAIAAITLPMATSIVFDRSLHNLGYWDMLASFPALVAMGFGERRLLDWKCPRCGRQFCGQRPPVWSDEIRAVFFTRRCAHCGLPRYATGPTADLDLPQGSRSPSGALNPLNR